MQEDNMFVTEDPEIEEEEDFEWWMNVVKYPYAILRADLENVVGSKRILIMISIIRCFCKSVSTYMDVSIEKPFATEFGSKFLRDFIFIFFEGVGYAEHQIHIILRILFSSDIWGENPSAILKSQVSSIYTKAIMCVEKLHYRMMMTYGEDGHFIIKCENCDEKPRWTCKRCLNGFYCSKKCQKVCLQKCCGKYEDWLAMVQANEDSIKNKETQMMQNEDV
jgi:hypothetical protein